MKPYSLKIAVIFFFCHTLLIGRVGATDSYRIVWQDLFDGNELNKEYWTVEVNGDGGGNSELQYYREENVSLGAEPVSGKSCLVITAKKENHQDKLFTSGRLNTQGKIAFKYGKLEASIKMPQTADGLWPAFWMLGENSKTDIWPKCGEIDIMEMGHLDGIRGGIQERYLNGACHWGLDWNGGSYPNYARFTTTPYTLQDDFHLFTIIWDDRKIKMYLDMDKYPDIAPYYEMDIHGKADHNAPGHYFHHPFHVLFDLAVGGHFTGITGNVNASKITALNKENDYEAVMYVDFVRLYQKGEPTEEFHGPVSGSNLIEETLVASRYRIIPNPTVSEVRIEGSDTPAVITLIDSAGKEVAKYFDTNLCYVSNLPAGNYIVKIEDETGHSEVHQLIKK